MKFMRVKNKNLKQASMHLTIRLITGPRQTTNHVSLTQCLDLP